jgi:hypothetical protein
VCSKSFQYRSDTAVVARGSSAKSKPPRGGRGFFASEAGTTHDPFPHHLNDLSSLEAQTRKDQSG